VYHEIVMGVIMVLIGGFVGVYWIKSRNLDPVVVNNRIKLNKQYTKELENELEYVVKDLRKIKGKLNSQKGSVGFSNNVNFDSVEGVGSAIKELLPQISGFLPKEAQQYLNDPKLIDMAVELYKKDPEKAKSILSGLIKKGFKPKSTPGSVDGRSSESVPQFGEGGAV